MSSAHYDDASAQQTLEALAARADAQMGAENFPVALRLLPRSARADLACVYRFARFVDDIGDEAAGSNQDRLALLDIVERQVRALATEGATLSAVAPLAGLVQRRGVPLQPLLDLLDANRMDQRVTSYPTFDDLLGYCRLSAAPIGRLVLHVAGAATEENIEASDAVCAALQVLEHCQDVGEDARAGRVYLPARELAAAGAADADLTASKTPPAVRRVIADQVQRSRELLAVGRPLVRRLAGWPRVAVAGYAAGGLATADALSRARYDVLALSIRPSKVRTALYALELARPARPIRPGAAR